MTLMNKLFDDALAAQGGNKTKLAERCGVTRQTIHSWSKMAELTRIAKLHLEDAIRSPEKPTE